METETITENETMINTDEECTHTHRVTGEQCQKPKGHEGDHYQPIKDDNQEQTTNTEKINYAEQTLAASLQAMARYEAKHPYAISDNERSVFFYLMGRRFADSYTAVSYASQWVRRVSNRTAWNLADGETRKVLNEAGIKYGHITGVTQ